MRKVLITNHAMANRTGSELYVLDLAPVLLRHGWSPIVYSLRQGEVAKQLRERSIPVVEDLTLLETPPDIIHGHHHLDAMVAMLMFPNTPTLYFCHGFLPWEETAVSHPSIGRYVAVDELCRERLMFEHGIPEAQIEVFLNFVDLSVFHPRPLLPGKPGRALVFSNGIDRGSGMGKVIEEACEQQGIPVDFTGSRVKAPTEKPGELLGCYDIVFAKARCALEAMATGCAVVVADVYGMGGMVTTNNYDAFRPYNFGLRVLQTHRDATSADVVRELAAYDPADAALVSQRARKETDLETYTAKLVDLYEKVIAEHQPVTPESALRSAAEYLKLVAGKVKEMGIVKSQTSDLRNQLAAAKRSGYNAGEQK